ncbi:MAG: glycosyltransferase family 4 protein [Candidatus Helarchaeota archaeon]
MSTSFPRYQNDYIAPFLLELFQQIQKNNNELFVIAPQMKGTPRVDDVRGVKVFRIKYTKNHQNQVLGDGFLIERLKESNQNKFNLLKFLLNALKKAVYLHKKKNFQIIHSQWIFPSGLLGLILKYLIDRPLVITIHGASIFLMNKYSFLKPILKLTLKKADLVIFNSSHTMNETLKIQQKIKNKRVIHQGINIKRFQDITEKEVRHSELFKEKPIILSIGRLIERKGFEYLIKSMREIKIKFPYSKLIIIGKGPLDIKLKELVSNLKLGKNVFFLGEVNGDDIPFYYKNSNVFVLPSIIDKNGDTEGLGIVLLEAMASGIPIIGTKVGGIPDIIFDGTNGILVEQKNSKSLAKAILKILSNENLSKKFTRNGLKIIKDAFQWKEISLKTINSYIEVLKKHNF